MKVSRILLNELLGKWLLPMTCVCFGLMSGQAMATTINFVGANAGNTRATVPGNSAFAQNPSSQYANGTEYGPAVGTLTGGAWSGFQTNRSVRVEDRLDVYSGYTYAETSFTAGAGGQINPANVHSFNLHTEVANWSGCCGLGSESIASALFRFEVQDAPAPRWDGTTGNWLYTWFPIYYLYEWNAEAVAADHAWNSGSSYRLQGAIAPDRGGDYWWTDPVLPYDGNTSNEAAWVGTHSGSRSGVFYIATGGDYLFQYGLQMGGQGIWGPPSAMDIDVRLAFSDTPFTSIPSPAPVPEPSTLLLLGSGLVGLAGMRIRFKA